MENLYKVVIVDDESLITKGLSERIDWESLSCRIAGVGNHGDEGLRLLEEHHPDILITDIIMPGKTGLELASYIGQRGMNTKIVLLTAHEEFQYAREAIACGVSDYIVKPIDKEEIVKAVQAIVKKLRTHNWLLHEQERKNKIALQMKPILSQAVLFDNTIYGISRDELAETYSDIYDDNFEKGVIALIQISKSSHDTGKTALGSLVRFSVWSCCTVFLEKSGLKAITKQTDDAIVIICAAKTTEQLKTAKELLKSLIQHIYQEKNIICNASISSIYHDISLMHLCYQEAKQLIRRSYFNQDPSVFARTDMAAPENRPKINLKVFFDRISEGDIEKAEKIYNDIAYKLESGKDAETAVEILQEIAAGLNRILEGYGEFVTEGVNKELIRSNGNFRYQTELIFKKIRDIGVYVKAKQRITDKVILQIERNYSDSSFSLNGAADKLGMNPSYLSRLFKKDKCVNFSQYLTDYRIEQAKKMLLATDYKNRTIAEKTGFSDEHYFCKVFKQKCRMTPKQYKSQGKSG